MAAARKTATSPETIQLNKKSCFPMKATFSAM
jgi:hypothetical protein